MDRKNRGTSSLFSCVLDDSSPAISALLEAANMGAAEAPSKRSKRRSAGPSPFFSAADERDDAGSTALHLAASHSATRCIRALIGAGASLDALDLESAWTPLHKAVWSGNLGAALLLIAAGAALDDVTEDAVLLRGRGARRTWLQKPLTPSCLETGGSGSLITGAIGGRDGLSPLDLATAALWPRQRVTVTRLVRERMRLHSLPAACAFPPSRVLALRAVRLSPTARDMSCSDSCRAPVRLRGPRPLCEGCLGRSCRSLVKDAEKPRSCYSTAVSLYSWGKASGFGLGYATPASRDVVTHPRPVDIQPPPASSGALGDVCAIAAGRHHTLVLTTGGAVFAFGLGHGGKLGLLVPSESAAQAEPSLFAGPASDARPRAPSSENRPGEARMAPPAAQVLPVAIPAFILAGIRIVQISVSPVHSLAVSADGELFAWGDNTTGCLGFGHSGGSAGPLLPSDSASASNTNSAPPQDGGSSIYPTPRRVEGALKRARVVCAAAASSHSLALAADGSLWSWGRNCHGQLGRKDAALQGGQSDTVQPPPGATAAAASASLRAVYTAWSPVRTDPLPPPQARTLPPGVVDGGVRLRRRRITPGAEGRHIDADEANLARAIEESRAYAGVRGGAGSSTMACKTAAAVPPDPSLCEEPRSGQSPLAPGHLIAWPLADTERADHQPAAVAASSAYSVVLTRGGGVYTCGNGRSVWQRVHFDVAAAQHRDAVSSYLDAEGELCSMGAAAVGGGGAPLRPGPRKSATPCMPTTPAAAAAALAAAGFSVLHYADVLPGGGAAASAAMSTSLAESEHASPSSWALQKRGKRVPAMRSDAPQAAAAAPRFGSSFGQSAIIVQVSAAPGHAAAVDTEGCVWTWGASEELLGLGPAASEGSSAAAAASWALPPQRVSSLARAGVRVASVAAAAHCTAAVDTLGDLWTWGDSTAAASGLLGHGEGGRALLPRRVPGVKGALLAVPGVSHVLLASAVLLPPLPPLHPSVADIAEATSAPPQAGTERPGFFLSVPELPDREGGDGGGICCPEHCRVYASVVDDLTGQISPRESLGVADDDYRGASIIVPSLSSMCQRALASSIKSLPVAHAALGLAENIAAPTLAAFCAAVLHNNADAVLASFAGATCTGISGRPPAALPVPSSWEEVVPPQAAAALGSLPVDSLASFSWMPPAALERTRRLATDEHCRMVALYKASKRAEYDMIRPGSLWKGRAAAAAAAADRESAGAAADPPPGQPDAQLRLASHYGISEPVFIATAESAAITRSLLFPDAPVAGEAPAPAPGMSASAIVEGNRFRQVLNAASAAWRAARASCGTSEEPWSPLATPMAMPTAAPVGTPVRTPQQMPENSPIGLGLGDLVLSPPAATPQPPSSRSARQGRARTSSSADTVSGEDDDEDDEHSRRSLRQRLLWEGAVGPAAADAVDAVPSAPPAVTLPECLARWISSAASSGLPEAAASAALHVLTLLCLCDEGTCVRALADPTGMFGGSAGAPPRPSAWAPSPPSPAGAAVWALLAVSSCGAAQTCLRRTKALRKKLLDLTSIACDATRSATDAACRSLPLDTAVDGIETLSGYQRDKLGRRAALAAELWCLVPLILAWLALAEGSAAAALSDSLSQAAVSAARAASAGYAELVRVGLGPGAFGRTAAPPAACADVEAAARAAVAAVRKGAPTGAAVRTAVLAHVPGAAAVMSPLQEPEAPAGVVRAAAPPRVSASPPEAPPPPPSTGGPWKRPTQTNQAQATREARLPGSPAAAAAAAGPPVARTSGDAWPSLGAAAVPPPAAAGGAATRVPAAAPAPAAPAPTPPSPLQPPKGWPAGAAAAASATPGRTPPAPTGRGGAAPAGSAGAPPPARPGPPPAAPAPLSLRDILEGEERAAAARARREARANEGRVAASAAAAAGAAALAERTMSRASGAAGPAWGAGPGAASSGPPRGFPGAPAAPSAAAPAAPPPAMTLAAIQAEQAAAAQRHEAAMRQVDERYAAAIAASPVAPGSAPHVPRRVRVDPGSGGSPWSPLPSSLSTAPHPPGAGGALHDIMSAQLAEALSRPPPVAPPPAAPAAPLPPPRREAPASGSSSGARRPKDAGRQPGGPKAPKAGSSAGGSR